MKKFPKFSGEIFVKITTVCCELAAVFYSGAASVCMAVGKVSKKFSSRVHVLSPSPAHRGPAGGLEVAQPAPGARPPPPVAAFPSIL